MKHIKKSRSNIKLENIKLQNIKLQTINPLFKLHSKREWKNTIELFNN